ncbi:MAG: KilA-N domain-containing protein [Bifidobacterium sp.]|nr:KilA-N domain-containing protein [Bifidobacterium sp.]
MAVRAPRRDALPLAAPPHDIAQPRQPRAARAARATRAIHAAHAICAKVLLPLPAGSRTKDAIKNWMRNRNTLEFLGTWEELNNPDFKGVEFDAFKQQAGLNTFVMTPTKWITATNAIGIQTKRGRHGGGTFAHVDIAMDFATWISPEFRLYVFREYKRLKQDESSRLNIEWQEKRMFASMNYRVHTDAIKDTMPPNLDKRMQGITYAREAEMLNLVVFGQTSKDWRIANPNADGNMRDHASATQNLILSTLEGLNAMLLRDGLDINQRYEKLWKMARQQEKSLDALESVHKIEKQEGSARFGERRTDHPLQ